MSSIPKEVCTGVVGTFRTRAVGRFDSILKGEKRKAITPPQLRAAGEWESLPSTSLVAATEFETYAQTDCLNRAKRWDGVREVCWEGLIPESALARFSYLNSGLFDHRTFLLMTWER